MRKAIKLAVAASMLVGMWGFAPAVARADDITCTSTLSNRHIDGSVIVPAGASCTLNDMRIDGDVKSYSRSHVAINRGHVDGNVQADGSSRVMVYGATIGGSVQSDNVGATRVFDSRVIGNIQLKQGGLNYVYRNLVNADVQLFTNSAEQRVYNNYIDGNLQCKENRQGVSGWANRVQGNAEDQCANLRPAFNDVPRGAGFYNEIIWAAERNITTGYDDGTYRPLNPVARDAMAAFLYRAAGSPAFTPPARSPFRDVQPNQAFYKEITWLAASNISTGYADGTFRPLAPVNRDAMSAFLYRASGSPAFTPPATSPFRDVQPGQGFYKEITWLAASGISTGYADGTFRPLNQVNRDAMAAFLYRTYN